MLLRSRYTNERIIKINDIRWTSNGGKKNRSNCRRGKTSSINFIEKRRRRKKIQRIQHPTYMRNAKKKNKKRMSENGKCRWSVSGELKNAGRHLRNHVMPTSKTIRFSYSYSINIYPDLFQTTVSRVQSICWCRRVCACEKHVPGFVMCGRRRKTSETIAQSSQRIPSCLRVRWNFAPVFKIRTTKIGRKVFCFVCHSFIRLYTIIGVALLHTTLFLSRILNNNGPSSEERTII